jgi:very-short-patch-repair endonuclease
MWKALRKLDLGPSHFRRQAPFGPYVVDFVCHAARLVVEVDGGVHRLPEVAARDAERQAWITERGYALVRVASSDALFNTQAVAERIAQSISAGAPTPTPPHEGEGLTI